MSVTRRVGDLNRFQYMLLLNAQELDAYRYGERVMEALRLWLSTSTRDKSPVITRGQFEKIFVRVMERLGVGNPLCYLDERGDCQVLQMMFDTVDPASKKLAIHFNFRDKDFTFFNRFPERNRLMECLRWALEETDFGKKLYVSEDSKAPH